MAKLFLSYAREDINVASAFSNQLRKHDHKVFQDIHGIPGGAEWEKELIKRIKWCDVLIVLVTEASTQSNWVYREFREAEKHKKVIIPVVVNDSDLPVHLQHLNALTLKFENENVNTIDGVILELFKVTSSTNQSPRKRRIAFMLVVLLLLMGVILVFATIIGDEDDNSRGKETQSAVQGVNITPITPTIDPDGYLEVLNSSANVDGQNISISLNLGGKPPEQPPCDHFAYVIRVTAVGERTDESYNIHIDYAPENGWSLFALNILEPGEGPVDWITSLVPIGKISAPDSSELHYEFGAELLGSPALLQSGNIQTNGAAETAYPICE